MDPNDEARVPATRRRFTLADDIVLLNEVVNIRPFMDLSRWAEVAENVSRTTGKMFTVRGVRERFDLILAHFIKNDRENLRKSGTEEQYSIRDVLLQDVWDLSREYGYKPKMLLRRSQSGAGGPPGSPAGTPARRGQNTKRRDTAIASSARERLALSAYEKRLRTMLQETDAPGDETDAGLQNKPAGFDAQGTQLCSPWLEVL
ncbi:uncharacterized protein LOC144146496 [Haemaphysalis longicornis]